MLYTIPLNSSYVFVFRSSLKSSVWILHSHSLQFQQSVWIDKYQCFSKCEPFSGTQ